ncbi:MAG TPA: hypothetical protein VFX98_05225 [Longimicrobiaceae bacterium]|nr:hypothetical protein [Longimicrobiaceae bacterium]
MPPTRLALLLAAALLAPAAAHAQTDGNRWVPDPLASKLLVGPTARSIPSGQFDAGVMEVLVPFVSFGAFDRFSLTAAMPLPMMTENVDRQFFLLPKAEVVRTGSLSAAVGLGAILGDEDIDAPVAMGFGVVTVGPPDRAVHFGAATGLIDRSGAEARGVLWMLGGEQRIGRRTKLLTENYSTFDGESTILSGGMRVFGRHFAVEVAGGVFISEDETSLFPLLNLTYSLGRNRP